MLICWKSGWSRITAEALLWSVVMASSDGGNYAADSGTLWKWKSPQQQIIDQLTPSLQSEQAIYWKFAWFIKILLVRLHLNITEFIWFLISLFQCFAIFICKIIKNLLTVIQRLCNFSLTIEVWEKVNPSPSHYLIKQVSIAKWMAGQTSLIMDGQSIRFSKPTMLFLSASIF